MAPKPDPGFGRGAVGFWQTAPRYTDWLFRWMWDLRVSGADRPDPPFVMAGNHFSHLDVVIIGRVLGPMRYLAVDELYGRSAAFDRLITHFGAIPMSRVRVPLRAVRIALAHLAKGGAVGVFPESRRVWTWGEASLKQGAAWLAVRADVPLVPVAIWGTQESFGRGARLIKRWPASLEVGQALHPGDYAHRDNPTAAMMDDWRSFIDGAIERLRRSRSPS